MVEKLEFRTWLDKQNSQKKKCVLMKKLSKLFLQHLPVPIQHVVKSFEVVMHMHKQISYKPIV